MLSLNAIRTYMRVKTDKGALDLIDSHAFPTLMHAQSEQQLCSFCDDIWLSQLDSVKGLLLAQPVSQSSR